MAYYKDADELTYSGRDIFDRSWEPGKSVSYEGIYECRGCGKEIAVNDYLPTEGDHQHEPHQGKIRWQLIVWASPTA